MFSLMKIVLRIFRKSLTNSYKKEINDYTNFLKNHDDNFISTWVAESILFRVDLENEGTLPSFKLEDGTICSELVGLAPLWTNLRQCLDLLRKKNNEETSYMVLNLWYLTVLSLVKSDLHSEGKLMWNELKRGLVNTESELRRIIMKRYYDDPTSRMRSFEILKLLPPHQLR